LSTPLFSQTVEIIQSNDYTTEKPGNDFAYIVDKVDTSRLQFVARYKSLGKGKESSVQYLYYSILHSAKAKGANSFKLLNYYVNEKMDEAYLILDTYFSVDSILSENYNLSEKNVVYIFGGKIERGNNVYSFKVNNEKKQLSSGFYCKLNINEGEEIKINKGGITGESRIIKGTKNKGAVFISLGGFGLDGASSSWGTGSVLISTGRIEKLDSDFGLVLTSILKPMKY